MKRREAFKKIGMLALMSGSGLTLLSSCANKDTETTKAVEATGVMEAISTPEVKSDREKLIVNRKYNKFKDPKNPTKGELKHTPDIIIGNKNEQGFTLVSVIVGQRGIIHPSTKEHWIDYISLYLNNKLYSKTEFINGGIQGFAEFYITLNKGDKLRAEAACNLHGIYDNVIKI
jgi:superoxide reductase